MNRTFLNRSAKGAAIANFRLRDFLRRRLAWNSSPIVAFDSTGQTPAPGSEFACGLPRRRVS